MMCCCHAVEALRRGSNISILEESVKTEYVNRAPQHYSWYLSRSDSCHMTNECSHILRKKCSHILEYSGNSNADAEKIQYSAFLLNDLC